MQRADDVAEEGPGSVGRPPATVGIDMDSVSVHLAGYGFDGGIDDGLAYRTALPRLLEVLAALDLRATFFIVGQDSDAHAADIRAE